MKCFNCGYEIKKYPCHNCGESPASRGGAGGNVGGWTARFGAATSYLKQQRAKRAARKAAQYNTPQPPPGEMGPPVALAPAKAKLRRNWLRGFGKFKEITSGDKTPEDVRGVPWWIGIVGVVLAIAGFFFGNNTGGILVGLGLFFGIGAFSAGLIVRQDIPKESLKAIGAILIVLASISINHLLTLILSMISYFSVSGDPYKDGAPVAASFRTLLGLVIIGVIFYLLSLSNVSMLIRLGFLLITIGMFMFNFDTREKTGGSI